MGFVLPDAGVIGTLVRGRLVTSKQMCLYGLLAQLKRALVHSPFYIV